MQILQLYPKILGDLILVVQILTLQLLTFFPPKLRGTLTLNRYILIALGPELLPTKLENKRMSLIPITYLNEQKGCDMCLYRCPSLEIIACRLLILEI
jgi:hypothetical protein